MYTGYETVFDNEGSWSFGNEFAGNVVSFSIDNTSSYHTDNGRNNFLVLGEGSIDDINSSIRAAENYFTINFSKAKTKFSLSLHYNHDNSCLFVNKK